MCNGSGYLTADGEAPIIQGVAEVARVNALIESTAQAPASITAAVGVPKQLPAPVVTSDTPPSFSTLSGDQEMQQLLVNRWNECVGCVKNDLPLSATVMIGGLLEGLILARIDALADKSPVFTAVSAPKEKGTGKTLDLKDWLLSNYIDVAHELGWISGTYRQVGEILRDYRNYIHPHKEWRHKKAISPDDAKMLWEIGKQIIRQLAGA